MRNLKPEPDGRVEVNLPEIRENVLSNSLPLYYVKKDTLPIIQINLIIPSGSIYDGQSNGLSNLTSIVIDEGAGGLTGLEISEKLDFLGSILNINSNKEYTTLSILSLEEYIEKSLEIFTKILLSPEFNEADFKREKDRLIAQVLNLNNDPAYVASTELNKIIYSNTPYQFPAQGSIQSLKGLHNLDIKNYYKKRYLPQGSFLIATGSLSEDKFSSLAEEFFGKWENHSTDDLNSIDITETAKSIVFIDKPDASQSEIRIGHFAKGRKSNDFYARTVLNSIIGGQFSSRINLNLREEKGFTYGAHSRYVYNQLGSTFHISTAVKSEVTTEAISEIFNELNSIKTDLAQDEVDFSKSYLVRSYPSLFETYSQISTNIALLPIYKLNKEYFKNYTGNVMDVKLDEVSTAAKENLKIENSVVVVVGKKEIFERELSQYAEKNGFNFIESTIDS